MGYDRSLPGGTIEGLALRELPTNLMAELGVLGGIAMDLKKLGDVADFLRPEHFADPMHGQIYAEQTRRILAGGTGDPVSLQTWFAADPEAPKVGGHAYLVRLLHEGCISPVLTRDYARVIYELAQRRQVITAAAALLDRAFDPKSDIKAVVTDGVGAIEKAISEPEKAKEPVGFDDAMHEAIIAAHVARLGGSTALSTGMPSVDRLIGGLEPGTLTVLGGRPGMGKSGLGWQWAVHIAREFRRLLAETKESRNVAGVSLEMPARSLARRALAAASQVSVEKIKRGDLTDSDEYALTRARKGLTGLPLWICDTTGMTAAVIRLKLRSLRRKRGPLGLIVVDHLHLVRGDEKNSRQGGTWIVGQIALELLALAKEFETPVLALAQLSRALEAREDRRPMLGDLRYSGDIEQNADNVLFIHREEYYVAKSPPARGPAERDEQYANRVSAWRARRHAAVGKAELIGAKIRDGEVRNVPLLFDGPTTSFSEPPSCDDEQGW